MTDDPGGRKPFAYADRQSAVRINAVEADEGRPYWYPDGWCYRTHQPRRDGGKTFYFAWYSLEYQQAHGCPNGATERESPAHELAKELILEKRRICVRLQDAGPLIVFLSDVVTEELLDRRKPDVSARVVEAYPDGLSAGDPIHIEIHVTNAVGEEKRADLVNKQQAVVEIDLSDALAKTSRSKMLEDSEGFASDLWRKLVGCPPGRWIVRPVKRSH